MNPLVIKVILSVFFGSIAIYLTYKTVIVTTSEVKYTIATVVGLESTSKKSGVRFEYNAKEVLRSERCFTKECSRNRIVGTKFLILYYLDDPSIYEVLGKVSNQNVEVPKNGWSEYPKGLVVE